MDNPSLAQSEPKADLRALKSSKSLNKKGAVPEAVSPFWTPLKGLSKNLLPTSLLPYKPAIPPVSDTSFPPAYFCCSQRLFPGHQGLPNHRPVSRIVNTFPPEPVGTCSCLQLISPPCHFLGEFPPLCPVLSSIPLMKE